jgi:hypothetical protein
VYVSRLYKPLALPLEQYDGTYDEDTWLRAESKAKEHLSQYQGGIMGKMHPITRQHLKKRDPEAVQQQTQLGQQLAELAATTEFFVCLKAGIEEDKLSSYIGRSQWPTVRRVPANDKHRKESRYSCQHADFWAATKALLTMHLKVSTRSRAHPQSELLRCQVVASTTTEELKSHWHTKQGEEDRAHGAAEHYSVRAAVYCRWTATRKSARRSTSRR